MHRFLGYVQVVWGALLLRTRLVRPKVDSVDFYAYRRLWNQRIAKAFHITFDAHGPRPGPGTLIVSNHFGFGDVNALCSLLPAEARANVLSKVEIGKLPIFGWHMRRYNDVLLNRKDKNARKRVIEESLARLDAGFSMVLFPEGTRSTTGVPKKEIRPALIDAALARGFPIQAVGISGTLSLIEKPFQYMKEHNVVRVDFGTVRRNYASAQNVWDDVVALWQRGTDAKRAYSQSAVPSHTQ